MAHLSPQTLTRDEQHALLAVSAPELRDHLIVSLALGTGLRLGEVIVAGFRRVLETKFKVPEDRISSAIAVFSAVEITSDPTEPSPLRVRDRADRWILATALGGQADVLVER